MSISRIYRPESWVSSKLHLAESRIHGTGVFASREISPGEVVVIWGGTLLSLEDVRKGRCTEHTHVAISEAECLATPLGAEKTVDDFMNHSCEPNLWMQDEVTLVANRAITPNEELVADYAIWLNDDSYRMSRLCNCGATACRHIVTGTDWRLPNVIELNYPHFTPFLNERIRLAGLAPKR